jgi:hypothetical protein
MLANRLKNEQGRRPGIMKRDAKKIDFDLLINYLKEKDSKKQLHPESELVRALMFNRPVDKILNLSNQA